MNTEKMRMLQAQKNITNAEIAKRTNTTPNYISDIRRGASTPSLRLLSMIAAVLEVETKELI